jgi:hypothetical protein
MKRSDLKLPIWEVEAGWLTEFVLYRLQSKLKNGLWFETLFVQFKGKSHQKTKKIKATAF